MEHGPLPPHERTWRHPSELAAQEQAVLRAETSPSVSRAFALTTGTIGLFAIAVLVLAVTPGHQPQPIAVSATTAPAVIGPSVASGPPAGDATIASARGVAPSILGPDTAAANALATPIGEGRYALVSQAAIGHSSASEVDVVLPSGRTTVGEVVDRTDDMVLIVLSHAEPGHEVAEHRPHDREVVTVMAEPPVTIAYAEVSTLEVAEGTAVVDSKGNLVGLCTKSGHGRRVRLIAVDNEMAKPDPATTVPDTTTVATVATAQSSSTVDDDSNDATSPPPDETVDDTEPDRSHESDESDRATEPTAEVTTVPATTND